MRIHECALHGMQFAVRRRKSFDGDDLGTVDHSQEQDAAIGRLVCDAAVAVEASDRDGAGAAVALRTSFLGAERAFAEPQMIEEGLGRSEVGTLDDAAAEDEANALARHGSTTPVGRVPVCGEQQRDVVVLVGIGDSETDGDFVEEEGVGIGGSSRCDQPSFTLRSASSAGPAMR